MLTFLQEKSAEVESAVDKLVSILVEMPAPWRERITREVTETVARLARKEPEALTAPPAPAEVPSFEVPVAPTAPPVANGVRVELPGCSDAVRTLFSTGRVLTSGEVVAELVNGPSVLFRTTSDNPASVVYTILRNLQQAGELKKDSDGRYKAAKKPRA